MLSLMYRFYICGSDQHAKVAQCERKRSYCDRKGCVVSEGPKQPARDGSGRFTTGKSGNPKGRPKKLKESKETPLEVAFGKTVQLTQGGERSEVGVDFAIDLQTLKDAMEGKARALKKVTAWVIKREKWRRAEYDKNNPSTIERVFGDDPDNAEEALQLLGIATRDWDYDPSDTETVRLQLAPWAVNQALRRKRGGKLSKDDISEIERCTVDGADIDWPKDVQRE